jgi:RNA polymerase sigma-70 factor (ECF subfamily)
MHNPSTETKGGMTMMSTYFEAHATRSVKEIKALAVQDMQAARSLLVQKYKPRLLRQAIGIIRNSDDAKDLVQEVLIRMLKEKRLFDEDFNIQAWLIRVNRNLCYNWIRNRNRRAIILNTYPLPRKLPPTQLKHQLEIEQKQHVDQALSTLSTDHREVLRLRYYQDMSYSEIAHALEIKIGTVMSRLSRAREQLLAQTEQFPDSHFLVNYIV